MVTASDDSTARLWDAATGKELAVLRGHEGAVWSAQFSPDGKRVVTASGDGTARVWDAATGRSWPCCAGMRTFSRVAVLAGREQVVTASDDGTARVWDAATGRSWPCCAGTRVRSRVRNSHRMGSEW